jgi:predicted ATPase
VAESIADALAGRIRLLVLDNCEHVLDAAADLVEAIFARSPTVKVLATSREGLRVPAEHLWPVPSLGVREGVDSTAVALFVERARAVVPGFALDGNADAVVEICRRLDGIALAIELAAARMVSMSPADVRDRLDDRFRLLSGGRRGLERHQTLRHAVQWSYDLLTDDERALLNRCSVFAGGFSLEAAVEVCGGDTRDEYTVLELLDSLVRKSLVVVDRSGGTTRYSLLETIRQFAEDQLAASGTGDEIRDRHALYFATASHAMREVWASPKQLVAHAWLDVELANLRAAFRWAVETDDLDAAATIAISAVIEGAWAQRLEPIAWAEELLLDARAQRLRQVRGLYMAASACWWLGRPEDGIKYGEAGFALLDRPGCDPTPYGLDYMFLGGAHMFAGQLDKTIELCATSVKLAADPTAMDRAAIVWSMAAMGRFDEAMANADEVVAVTEARGVPHAITFAYDAWGKAFAAADPRRTLTAKRRSQLVARENHVRILEAVTMRELAGLEALHGDQQTGLASFDETIDSFHQSGDMVNLACTFGWLAVFFERIDRHAAAAILYGVSSRDAFAMASIPPLPGLDDHLRDVLGAVAFDEMAREGAAMDRSQAVVYAHAEIQHVREDLSESP